MYARYRALLGAAALCVAMALPALATADGGGGGGAGNARVPDKLDPVREVLALGDYRTAIAKLDALRVKYPDDPDVLNLLGFSYRKQGRFDEALGYYQAALKIKPQHRGANEYLGELYLETGQLQKAEERLAVLDKECFLPCDEYTDLKNAIRAYKSRAKN